MKADHSDLLNEAVPESLKSILLSSLFLSRSFARAAHLQFIFDSFLYILLVMIGEGIFQPGTKTQSGEDIWALSWQIIDAFCPSLKPDVFAKVEPVIGPQSPKPNQTAEATPTGEAAVAPSSGAEIHTSLDQGIPPNPSTEQPTATISPQTSPIITAPQQHIITDDSTLPPQTAPDSPTYHQPHADISLPPVISTPPPASPQPTRHELSTPPQLDTPPPSQPSADILFGSSTTDEGASAFESIMAEQVDQSR